MQLLLNGHLQICQAIVANIDDKNPSCHFGFTPLHFAAYQGHLEILQDKTKIQNAKGAILHYIMQQLRHIYKFFKKLLM